MRILVVDHTAVCFSNRVVYRALQEQEGFGVTVLAPKAWRDQSGAVALEPETSTLHLVASPIVFKGKSHRVLYVSLRKILRHARPDIIYVNSEPEGYLAWQAVRARRDVAPQAKLVLDSWRNVDHSEVGFPYKLASLHARIEEQVLQTADHCIVHTETSADLFRRMGFNKVTIIPPHLDSDTFKPAERVMLPSLAVRQEFTIGYIGRFVPEKGIDVLLRAATGLKFPFRILLVGHGPALPDWQHLAGVLGLENRFFWRPPVAHERVPLVLAEMDLLVLPSRSTLYWKEQFGRILIEAMACGVPVIGSSCGEIPRVVERAGLIFDEGNADSLTKCLDALYHDAHLRSRLAEQGLDRVRTSFELRHVVGRYADLFHSLCPS